MLLKSILSMLAFLLLISPVYSTQSTITEVKGYACMGEEKSRKQTRQDALMDAKRKALEYAVFYIKSETKIKNFELEKDILNTYARANVKILESKEHGWYKDEHAGDCFKITIKAEIIPDEKALKDIASITDMTDPGMPLKVKLWTDKEEYRKGQKIKIYLQGNKPFYARVIYKDVKGRLLQILPNPFRHDNYFNGGVVYQIPSGNDRYELEISPPIGEEDIIAYASTSQLGDIKLENAGGIYRVKTRAGDVGVRTRGVQLKLKKDGKENAAAEFFEVKKTIKTKR